MKKKKIRILLFSIIVCFIIMIIAIFCLQYQIENYTVIIKEIRDGEVVAKDDCLIDNMEEIEYGYYTFSTKEILIINEKWKKINSNELENGNIIQITTIRDKTKVKNDIGYTNKPIDNILFIKVLNNA